jgi:hypothetical protein
MGRRRYNWVRNPTPVTCTILTGVQQSFCWWITLAPARQIPSIVWELALGRIPVSPAVHVLCDILYFLFHPHVAIPERGQRACTKPNEGV